MRNQVQPYTQGVGVEDLLQQRLHCRGVGGRLVSVTGNKSIMWVSVVDYSAGLRKYTYLLYIYVQQG